MQQNGFLVPQREFLKGPRHAYRISPVECMGILTFIFLMLFIGLLA
jgi:hypothetical protein